jgi:hypothetical protein
MELDRVLTALRLIVEVEETGQLTELNISDLVKLVKDAEQGIEHDYCLICRTTGATQADPHVEQHHVAGKVVGEPDIPDTVTVCGDCHNYLSDHQRAWLIHSRDRAYRFSSYFFGWADIFDLLFVMSGVSSFKRLAEKFRSQGWHIRNNPRKGGNPEA